MFAFPLRKRYKACQEKENVAVIDSRAGSPLCKEEVGLWALEQ